jgi:hypothetical protein
METNRGGIMGHSKKQEAGRKLGPAVYPLYLSGRRRTRRRSMTSWPGFVFGLMVK